MRYGPSFKEKEMSFPATQEPWTEKPCSAAIRLAVPPARIVLSTYSLLLLSVGGKASFSKQQDLSLQADNIIIY